MKKWPVGKILPGDGGGGCVGDGGSLGISECYIGDGGTTF